MGGVHIEKSDDVRTAEYYAGDKEQGYEIKAATRQLENYYLSMNRNANG